MSFEKFEKHGESFSSRISIWKNGSLGVSAGAFNVYELTDKIYVVLFYNRESRCVGLKFSTANEPGAVKMTARNSGGIIPAKAFFENYGIDYSVVRNYVLSWSESAGMLVFDLDLPIDDDECPEYPHAAFVESVFAGVETFFAKHPHSHLTVEEKARVARRLFSMAAHHHMGTSEVAELLEEAVQPGTSGKNRRALAIHKLLNPPK